VTTSNIYPFQTINIYDKCKKDELALVIIQNGLIRKVLSLVSTLDEPEEQRYEFNIVQVFLKKGCTSQNSLFKRFVISFLICLSKLI